MTIYRMWILGYKNSVSQKFKNRDHMKMPVFLDQNKKKNENKEWSFFSFVYKVFEIKEQWSALIWRCDKFAVAQRY